MANFYALKNRKRIVFIALLVLVASVAAAWLAVRPRDPLFHGKPESYWMAHLSYRDDEQVRQWRQFGPDGVRVLVRGLEGADRPGDRIYRHVYHGMRRMLPDLMLRLLPAPRMDLTRGTRMMVVGLLARLGNDAKLATPAMTRALKDEDPDVRQLAITFFTEGEDDNAPLNRMDAETKGNLLPLFLQAMQDKKSGVRNNAVIALRYYQEQAQMVAPVLVKALQDPDLQVRRVAADALKRVDAATAAKAGVN